MMILSVDLSDNASDTCKPPKRTPDSINYCPRDVLPVEEHSVTPLSNIFPSACGLQTLPCGQKDIRDHVTSVKGSLPNHLHPAHAPLGEVQKLEQNVCSTMTHDFYCLMKFRLVKQGPQNNYA